MTITTAEKPVRTVLAEAQAAEAALAASDAAAAEAARIATAKPATRAQLKAEAESRRKELEARRANLIEEYALQVNSVWLATEVLDGAQLAHVDAALAAKAERDTLDKLRREIADSYGLQAARDARDDAQLRGDDRAAAQAAVRKAATDIESATRDLPPVPAPLTARLGSRAPGVAAEYKRRRDALQKLNV